MSRHLDHDRLLDLLAGRLDREEEAALFLHLQEGDCAECEACLEKLDPATEQLLYSALTRAERVSPADPGKRQSVIEQALRRPWFSPQRIWAPAVAAAALLILAVAWLAPFGRDETSPHAGQRIKGDAEEGARVQVEMSLGLVGLGPDGKTTLQRLRKDETVEHGGSLVFTVDISGSCWLYVVRLGAADGEVLLPEDLAAQVRSPAGSLTPRRGESPLGYDLGGLAGEQRFGALCSQKKLASRERILALARAALSGRDGSAADGLTFSAIRLNVGPGGVRP